ncbi:MAG: type I polyketide synthase [Candidatus Eremiobacteraeota bacterium]|nr:type I polyketide synthase [Candidatus Eremiobacteraeota bacterium]MCW5867950.1 type I polyketide synthase [Candidatus Eremiobacteraeota bacterium]
MHREPIAVVGLGAMLPGAFSLDQFWSNLIQKVDVSREAPAGRWVLPPELAYDPRGSSDHVISKRGFFLDPFELDPAGLLVDKEWLKDLDPLYKVALQASRQAFLDGRHESLERSRVGVILAAIALPTDGSSALTWNRYQARLAARVGAQAESTRRQTSPWNRQVTGLPASIVARALGLGGGSYTLDAACASSLYSIKLACDELQARRADAMLAGGVSRPDSLYTQMGFTALGALSPSGRCAPFDKGGDGLVVGEGAGVLLLKRLSDAEAQGDKIYGVIRGIGLSNDIGGSLLAPDTEGQLRAMHQSYQQAGWKPNEVQLIECHGTGTPMGDRIEVKSLIGLWQGLPFEPGQCAIGSVKSTIGHLLTGAGGAGMIKVLLGMQHGVLPPSLNCENPNPQLQLHGSPFRIQQQAEEWKADIKRAAVSAFGFGGVNAHVLVEEYQPRRQLHSVPALPARPVAIVGLAAEVGSAPDLKAWLDTVFAGHSLLLESPPDRWNGEKGPAGAFIQDFDLEIGAFKIPPMEMPEVLPQQTLMLRVAAQAAADAGLDRQQRRPRAGALIGISLDMDTTDFHLRWALPEALRNWGHDASRLAELRDLASKPLDSTRTLGALGSIVASRLAREFNFGGPSFAISAEEASGLKALEVALRALQQNEMDTALVTAIDLQGDPRSQANLLRPQGEPRPFDPASTGSACGEGAVAVVLKRLEDCTADDKVYAIIRGYGAATGGRPQDPTPSPEAQGLAVFRAHQEAGSHPTQVSYVEACGSGVSAEDEQELAVLQAWYGPGEAPCALGSLTSQSGLTGACSGLLSLAKAAAALATRRLPPLPQFEKPLADLSAGRLHVPIKASAWLRDRSQGPRQAAVHCLSSEGNAVHLVLEQGPQRQRLWLRQPQGGLFGIFPGLREFIEASHESLHETARRWSQQHPGQKPQAYLVAEDRAQLQQSLQHLEALLQGPGQGQGGLYFSRSPLRAAGKVAFLYPGSGNHYAGMGRELALLHPEVVDRLDEESDHLRSYMAARWTVPYRQDWPADWTRRSAGEIASDLHRSIFGQVMFGLLASDIVQSYGLKPEAAIGYSLGESAALMSLRAWPGREEIHDRMQASDLFRRQLGGPCLAARRFWKVPEGQPFEWRVAVLTRPAEEVRPRLQGKLELLIVNTDKECVVGGDAPDLASLIEQLGCQAVYLEAVPTVHSQAVEQVAQEYFDLHHVRVASPPGLTYYSAYRAEPYEMTSENSARSIVEQAVHGLDFTKVIRRAYADGIRYFVEIGPGNSCTRMVEQILHGQPQRALALNSSHRGEWAGLLHLWAGLLAEECPGLSLSALYPAVEGPPPRKAGKSVTIRLGALLPQVRQLPEKLAPQPAPPRPKPTMPIAPPAPVVQPSAVVQLSEDEFELNLEFEIDDWEIDSMDKQRVKLPALQSQILASAQAGSRAHQKFLELHQQAVAQLAEGITLLQQMGGNVAAPPTGKYYPFCDHNLQPIVPVKKPCVLDYDQCMEFAIGSIAKVLGPMFKDVDTYPTRVRLPDDPLMLVHRITEIVGEPGSMTGGKVVTEHDVQPGAWYLDNGRMPVCVTVEAGQADLFLSGYLGIDLQTKGQRTYRLLDATVSFHRQLPTVGETIAYDIRIDRFVRQGETYLFFFEFDGTIDGQPMITMRNGCAGFFEDDEIRNSKGIILTPEETQKVAGKVVGYRPLAPFTKKESYSDAQVNCLRVGDLGGCFGAAFAQLPITNPPHLPSGRMKLYDRVLEVDPKGGRFGLGRVRAEADVHPDDWFLTCHFVDDMVMPGTLMYECCAHTLRFLLLRMGWVGEADQVTYEPKIGVPAVLRCRGPVTVETKKVQYEVEIKEVGYGPEPYVIADALMYADGKCIVRFVGMSMRLVGLTQAQLESLWPPAAAEDGVKALYDRESIMQFAYGKPSLAFGDKYKIFDEGRRIARLPRPPYAFMDRVVEVNQEPWVLQAGGWIEAHYFVPEREWYFAANRQPTMAFAILLEIALQPCGWLAAYAGSALRSNEDLKFRNLGGTATLFRELTDQAGMLRIRVRMSKVSEAGGMIIENFDMQVLQGDTMVYEGTTYFGFFSKAALDNQVGIREAKRYQPSAQEKARGRRVALPRQHPLTPEDSQYQAGTSACMPGGAMQMMDEADLYVRDGGPHGLGYIHGIKQVNPDEWFFQAHFYMDPVWPGSLGLEAFLQLLKVLMLDRWPQLADTHRFECIATNRPHTWGYRGQVIPTNKIVEVEAWVTRVEEGDEPVVTANGFLVVDGKPIYEMTDFAMRLVRA